MREIKYWSPPNLFGGIDLVDKEWRLPGNKTAKSLNMWFKDGELGKRWGQSYASIDLTTTMYNAYKYKFNGKIIFHSGTKLYSLDTLTGIATQIYSTMNGSKGVFFKFNSKLYYLQSGNYVQYDGITATAVIPYIPTIIINRTPTGGGNTNEGYNRIGAGFINSFNSDGTSTVYQLTDTNLDAKPITASIDYGITYDKVETTHFTVNRTTGVVTWLIAPPSGTNRTRIKAFKTIQEDIDSVLNCKFVKAFGGQNDNRVFFGGNGTGYYYWTGISNVGIDATYFPWNNYNIVGLTDEPINGFGKHYDTLVILKTRELYGVTYTFNGTVGIFNTFQINDQYGCDCPDTIQNINNDLVYLNSTFGVCILVGTSVGSQRDAFPISRNINPRLLKESNLTSATSVDFDGKYWLCVNDKVYLWDYYISPYVASMNPEEPAKILSWWYFDNIAAGSFIIDGQDLYYTHRTLGRIVKFINVYDKTQFYDFDSSYKAIYRLPLQDFGGGVYEFNVNDVWCDVRGDLRTTFDITYITSDSLQGEIETDPITVGTFKLTDFSLIGFSLRVMGYKTTFHMKPLEKKIDLFGFEISNSDGGRDMNISNIVVSYFIGKRKK